MVQQMTLAFFSLSFHSCTERIFSTRDPLMVGIRLSLFNFLIFKRIMTTTETIRKWNVMILIVQWHIIIIASYFRLNHYFMWMDRHFNPDYKTRLKENDFAQVNLYYWWIVTHTICCGFIKVYSLIIHHNPDRTLWFSQ